MNGVQTSFELHLLKQKIKILKKFLSLVLQSDQHAAMKKELRDVRKKLSDESEQDEGN